ncbi:uncharacterized protein LOC133933757 [Platichthys flesus]|uniref:uncharacterized protein LOC133933757 n=1 Tax=Platichthys flesus TaxID=8260 RepID=UPI002DB7DA69|nr:uncharacterized protein LOC133933757 [Platichthys flesus]
MWHSVFVLAALLARVSSQAVPAAMKLQKKVGDDVVLSPDSVTGPINHIIWKDGQNIGVQWDTPDSEVTYNRHFKGRTSLNTSTGALTIRGLNRNDSTLYTPEINGFISTPTRLIVLAPVPVPKVTATCNEEKSSCTLTCEGNLTDVELVIYNWKLDDVPMGNAPKDHHIEKEESLNVKEFSCELENPVSLESSKRIANPFTTDTTPERQVNINTGLMVFLSLLGAVGLLTAIHRWRAGMWFFQKESMPWEADFWSKDERGSRDAETNGTTTRRERGRDDEETALT